MMSIYRSFWNFFQPGYIKRGVLDWVVITMPEAVPGHFVNSFRCLVLTIWYGLDPSNVFLAQLRDITKGHTPKTRISDAQFVQYVHVLCLETCRACTAAQTLSSRPLIHGGSRRMPGKLPRLSPQTPQPDSQDVPGPSHTTTVLMHYLLYTVLTYYIGLILAKIVRHLVEISSDGAGSSFAHSVPTSLKSILFNQ